MARNKTNLPPRHLYYLGEVIDGVLQKKRYTTYAISLEDAVKKQVGGSVELTEVKMATNGWKVATMHYPREVKEFEVRQANSSLSK